MRERGSSRTDPLELHVPNAVADLAEEDLLLHPMGEAYGPTYLRPCPAMALRDHVDQVLGMVRLRVPFVRAEVGAVLETRLGDHATTREVLVGPEAGLADRGRFRGAFQELRQVEHGPFAQRPDPVLARRLLRGAAPRVHLEVDRAAPGFYDVSPLPQIPVDEVEDLERRNRGAGRPKEVPCGNGPASAPHLEAFRLDEVHRLQQVQFEAAARARDPEVPPVVQRTRLRGVLDDDAARGQLPRHAAPAKRGPAIKGSTAEPGLGLC